MMKNHSRFFASKLIVLCYTIILCWIYIILWSIIVIVKLVTKAIFEFSSTFRKRSDRQNRRDCRQQHIGLGNSDNTNVDIDSLKLEVYSDIDIESSVENQTPKKPVAKETIECMDDVPALAQHNIGNTNDGTDCEVDISVLNKESEDIDNESKVDVSIPTQQSKHDNTNNDIDSINNESVVEVPLTPEQQICISNRDLLCVEGNSAVGIESNRDYNTPTRAPNEENADTVCKDLKTTQVSQTEGDSVSRTKYDEVGGRGCVSTLANSADEDQVDYGTEREQLMEKPNTSDYNDTEISSNKHNDVQLEIDLAGTNGQQFALTTTNVNRNNVSIARRSTFKARNGFRQSCMGPHNNDNVGKIKEKKELKLRVIYSSYPRSSGSNAQHENGHNMKINRQIEDKWCSKMVIKDCSYHFNITQLAKDETSYAKCDRSWIYELFLQNTNTINVYILERFVIEGDRDPPIPRRLPLYYEWGRFVSFEPYEGNGNVIELARHGFHHDPQHGETWTSCIFCPVEFDAWKSGDNVQEKHPDCPMYTQTSHNVPIHVEDNQMNRRVNQQRETEGEGPATSGRGQVGVELRQPVDGTSSLADFRQRAVESTGTLNLYVPRERNNCHVVDGAYLRGESQSSASDDSTCEGSVDRQEEGHFNRRDVCRHGGDGNRRRGPVIDLGNNTVELGDPELPRPALGLNRTFNQRDLQISQPPGSADRT